MKISKLALIALLGGALMSFGCSDDANGTGGTGGTAGAGGAGGAGGAPSGVMCVETTKMCGNASIDPTEETCTLAAPPADNNCAGDESLVNPGACAASGNPSISIMITQLEVGTETVDVDGTDEEWGQCNNGYNLDGCDGNSCLPGMLAPGEGENGVDNALAGLAPVLAGVDGNLGGVNDAFNAGLCSGNIDMTLTIDANTEESCALVTITSVGACQGGADDGTECTSDEVCTDAGTAVECVDDLCAGGANDGDACTEAADCAPVFCSGAVSDVVMNVSATDCISGTIGSLPLNIEGVPGSMENAVIRATLSEGGLSNGSLGATIDADTAVAIAEALLPGAGAVVGQVLDINNDLSGDPSMPCDALSAEMTVGGVVPAAQ